VTTLGAIYLPQFPPERLRAVARAADEAGLDELWFWEDCFLNGGVSAAAAALAWTTRLRVGVGILPVPLRNVALTAMEIATLARMFGPRFMPGAGHGVQDWMAQVGARVESPMTLLREYVTALQALLRGETVTVAGRYVTLDGVRLDHPPEPPPELLLGATGPRTLRLAGELAAGTVLSGGTSPAGVAEARRTIAAPDRHRVVVFVAAATGPGAAERLAAVPRADPATEDPGVSGDARAVAAGLEPFFAAGADTVLIQPTPDEPDPVGFMRFVAAEVKPLILGR
jgi:alkanesulfonate monooxygenase SsuD/methylene tetrahydromethanopterin reductase-like flavin-dependent oxidoreductase (luciferase family)